MKQTIAILALVAGASALKLRDVGYPWGSPYSFTEQESTSDEVQEAWRMVEERKGRELVEQMQKEKKDTDLKKYIAKVNDWNEDMDHPDHNQGRVYEIDYNV